MPGSPITKKSTARYEISDCGSHTKVEKEDKHKKLDLQEVHMSITDMVEKAQKNMEKNILANDKEYLSAYTNHMRKIQRDLI